MNRPNNNDMTHEEYKEVFECLSKLKREFKLIGRFINPVQPIIETKKKEKWHWFCPHCKHRYLYVDNEYPNYCSNCGGAIDWSILDAEHEDE